MAKRTWVNVSGTWRAVKNVWVNIGGAWKQKVIPKGNIGGVWKDFIQYLLQIYDSGTEYIPIVKYASNGTLETFVKGPTYITAQIASTSTGVASSLLFGTDIPVDITNFNTVYVDYKNQNYNVVNISIEVATTKTGTAVASALYSYSAQETIKTLDISALSGQYYVRLEITNNAQSINEFYIYKIWLD